jgi:transposase
MLSDGQWALLEPLIEACRPKGKTPPQDLRCTLSAILWRHENGAMWRAVPEGSGRAGGRPRSSSAGHELASGSGCSALFRSARSSSGWCSSMARACGPIRRRQGLTEKGDLKLSEMIVKHLAALVAAMALRLA